jgi:hypothetical protein
MRHCTTGGLAAYPSLTKLPLSLLYTMPPKKLDANSPRNIPPSLADKENTDQVHEEPAGKIPRNAKWLSVDDATLVDSLKAFADGNSADNGTFKFAAFTAAAKTLKDSHTVSGGAPKTAKSCSRRWATVSSMFLALSY